MLRLEIIGPSTRRSPLERLTQTVSGFGGFIKDAFSTVIDGGFRFFTSSPIDALRIPGTRYQVSLDLRGGLVLAGSLIVGADGVVKLARLMESSDEDGTLLVQIEAATGQIKIAIAGALAGMITCVKLEQIPDELPPGARAPHLPADLAGHGTV
jgi:hypothetical protein